MAKVNKDFVIGFVSQKQLVEDEQFLYLTPGVKLEGEKDNLGQNYISPDTALERGSDIIIVGRGIYSSQNIAQAAEQYRLAGWSAYKKQIQQ